MKKKIVLGYLLLMMALGSISMAANVAPKKVLVVLDATQSTWSTTRRSVCFYDVTDLSSPNVINQTPMFSVWTGYEDSYGSNFEDPGTIAVNPHNGTVYMLAYDSGSAGVPDTAGDIQGDYDLYRIDYKTILNDWITNNRPKGTMYAPQFGPDHNFGGFSAENVSHPDHAGTTIFMPDAIQRIGEVDRNQDGPFFDYDLEFVNAARMVLLDNQKGADGTGDIPENDHSYYALNRTATTGTGNPWNPTETWGSNELGLCLMDYDAAAGVPVGRSEPVDIAYYNAGSVEGVWVLEADGGGDDVAFFEINNWTGMTGNGYREHNIFGANPYPAQFGLDQDPTVDPTTNDGSGDWITVDAMGNLRIGESGFFDTPQHEPKVITRVIEDYDLADTDNNGKNEIDFGPWGVTAPMSPTLDDDTAVTDGRNIAYDKQNLVYYVDIDSGSVPNVVADLYVYDITTGTLVYEELNCLNHFVERHGIRVFTFGDINNDGLLTFDDYLALLEILNTADPVVAETYDLTGDKVLDCDDLAVLADALGYNLQNADVNNDGQVDLTDVDIFARLWLTDVSIDPCDGLLFDFDRNGRVNLIDFAGVAAGWTAQ